jgi:hypothetical protein
MKREKALEVAAEEYGRENGKSAASWYDVDEENAARILAGIEDGDPAILDTFPGPDLSGQWADEPNGRQVYENICNEAEVRYDEDDETDVLDVYEEAYNTAVEDELARRARYYLSGAS